MSAIILGQDIPRVALNSVAATRDSSRTFRHIGNLMRAGLEALTPNRKDAAACIAKACRALEAKAEWEPTWEPADGHVCLSDARAPRRMVHNAIFVHPNLQKLLSTQNPSAEIRSGRGRRRSFTKGLIGGAHDIAARSRPERAQERRDKHCQLESELAHMNRLSMMGELTASLVHKIAQPTAAARNNACAAIRFLEMKRPDLAGEALGCIVNDVDRAADIIDRIRDHIKKAPPRSTHFDLNEAIVEVIGLARGAIARNEASVQTRLVDNTYPVYGDRIQLQQVILNLILNAVEAMSSDAVAPRELLVSAEPHEVDGVLVGVRDSGPGIDHEGLERIFEPFYTTKSNGMGMGLSICGSIIASHGGRLWAEPNVPRGAALWFTLPGRKQSSRFVVGPAAFVSRAQFGSDQRAETCSPQFEIPQDPVE